MRAASLLHLTLAVALGAGAMAFAGTAAVHGAAAAAPGAEPRDWLVRIQSAARERDYQGTMVFTAGAVVASSKVGHSCLGEQSFERVEALDGRQQRVYRHNNVVYSFWPQARVVTVEQRDPLAAEPILPELDPRLHEHYDLQVLGADRAAGREAQVLLLKPRDDFRFAQRLWVDRATGLMLRADVINPQGAVIESSAFSDIEIDARPQRDAVLAAMKKTDGYRLVKLASVRTQLAAEGWMLGPVPPGFRMVGCVRRAIGMPGPDAGTRTPDAVQAVFSDGLARVSIFIEPHDPAHPRQPLLTQLGATLTLMKSRGERWWITVMGDVPAPTLKQFAGALERRP